jgi:hypothetical protein
MQEAWDLNPSQLFDILTEVFFCGFPESLQEIAVITNWPASWS